MIGLSDRHFYAGDVPVDYNNKSLVTEVEFPVSKKIYKGIPLIVSGRFDLDAVKSITELDILSAHGPTYKSDLIDYYTNEDQTHRTIYDIKPTTIQEVLLFVDVYNDLVDKTKLKFVRLDLSDMSGDDANVTVSHFRDTFPSVVLIAGPSIDYLRTVSLREAGADVVAVGHHGGREEFLHYESMTGMRLDARLLTQKAKDCCLLADLGCENPGEVCKAFSYGPSFVGIGPDIKPYLIEDIFAGLRMAMSSFGENHIGDLEGKTLVRRTSK